MRQVADARCRYSATRALDLKNDLVSGTYAVYVMIHPSRPYTYRGGTLYMNGIVAITCMKAKPSCGVDP